MKILIFEGIASSGKSTIISNLKKELGGAARVIGESKTHISIRANDKEIHLEFFRRLINSATQQDVSAVIFDRLYLTQAFRANVRLSAYSEIEEMLAQYDATTILLKVEETAIPSRIMASAEQRGPTWSKYVKTKGVTEEAANYYINQQRGLLNLLKDSKLRHTVFDTTNHQYKEVSVQILKLL